MIYFGLIRRANERRICIWLAHGARHRRDRHRRDESPGGRFPTVARRTKFLLARRAKMESPGSLRPILNSAPRIFAASRQLLDSLRFRGGIVNLFRVIFKALLRLPHRIISRISAPARVQLHFRQVRFFGAVRLYSSSRRDARRSICRGRVKTTEEVEEEDAPVQGADTSLTNTTVAFASNGDIVNVIVPTTKRARWKYLHPRIRSGTAGL